MLSVGSLTLFMEPPFPDTGVRSLLLSVTSHSVLLGLVLLGLSRVPHLEIATLARPTSVRLLDPAKEEAQIRWTAANGADSTTRQSSSAVAAAVDGTTAPRFAPPKVEQLPKALQTLIQPDAPPKLPTQPNLRVPVMVMWAPENGPPNNVTLAPPRDVAVINVRPSIVPPNHEATVAEIKLSASLSEETMPAFTASTTVPVIVHSTATLKQVPQTSTSSLSKPTPAQIVSLSDTPMPHEAVTIPLANQTAYVAAAPSLRAMRADKSTGSAGEKLIGAGKTPGTANGSSDVANQTSPIGASGSLSGADSASSDGLDAGPAIGSAPKLTRITLPKDGQYGVVVVGSSLAEEYPETIALWGSRLVYTVYLHVGTSKNWILQYAVPRADEAVSAGSGSRPEAPWPFEVVRPDLALSDDTFDALMVHGFVSITGRFEQLALVSPQGFAQEAFVLSALRQWHFRPARENGKVAPVEVLLIIPEDLQ